MDKRLNAGFIDMTNVGCRLAWFLAEDDGVGVDESECVDQDFAFDGLDWVYYYCHGAGVQGFKGLASC